MELAAVRALSAIFGEKPDLERRFRELRRQVFPIRPSQYDVTNLCNLTCVGCLYFSGGNSLDHAVVTDGERLDAFYRSERERGVNFGHFGGAEPSLNQAALRAAHAHIPRGVVYTNGLKRIGDEIGYRLHISVWSGQSDEALLRGRSAFRQAVANYAGDARAVVVMTLTSLSLPGMDEVARICAQHDLKLTFNQFSPTQSESSRHLRKSQRAGRAEGLDLRLQPDEAAAAMSRIEELKAEYPGTIIYSTSFGRWTNSSPGIHRLDGNGWAVNCASRLSDKMRHYLPDLSRDATSKCCTPNVACGTCRLYSMNYATRIESLSDGVSSAADLEGWIEAVETWKLLFCPVPRQELPMRDPVQAVENCCL